MATTVTPATFSANLTTNADLILGDGTYPDVTSIPNGVTLTSENLRMAKFNSFKVNGVNNLTINGIHFKYDFTTGDDTGLKPFQFNTCDNLLIINSLFEGDEDGTGYPTGRGCQLQADTNSRFQDNEIRTFWKGLSFAQCSDLIIRGNDVSDFRSDGMSGGRVERLLIEGNHVHSWRRDLSTADHGDCLQFQRHTGIGSHYVTIKDNIFDVADGFHAQTIFAGSDGDTVRHTNWIVHNNLIYNNHTHGIAISQIDNFQLTNNTLIAVPRAPGNAGSSEGITVPAINVSDATGFTFTGNISASYVGDNASDYAGSGADNVLIEKSDYTDTFDQIKVGLTDGYNEWEYYTDSAADGYGSSLMAESGATGPSLPIMPADGQVTLSFTVG